MDQQVAFSLPISPPPEKKTPLEEHRSFYTPHPPRILSNQLLIYQCPLGEEELREFQKNPVPPPHKPDPNKEKIQTFVKQQRFSRTWPRPYEKQCPHRDS